MGVERATAGHRRADAEIDALGLSWQLCNGVQMIFRHARAIGDAARVQSEARPRRASPVSCKIKTRVQSRSTITPMGLPPPRI